VCEFPQGPARMGPETARFYAAVVDRLLSHDGSPALARHVADAVLKEDTRGARLAKEHKDSKRRIDAAVAAVMARDWAAVLAGDRGPSSYIYTATDHKRVGFQGPFGSGGYSARRPRPGGSSVDTSR
jgi:hypothetical protein